MTKPKLLLHVCCAPCSGLLSQQLLADFEVMIYFDNPNIWPEEEFLKRAQEAKRYFKSQGVEFILVDYDYEDWKKITAGLESESEKGKRCKLCYHHRLVNTAKFAAEHQFDFFTTSLSISPYKDDQAIKNLGQALAKKYRLKFLADDFRLNDGLEKHQNLPRSKVFIVKNIAVVNLALKMVKYN